MEIDINSSIYLKDKQYLSNIKKPLLCTCKNY